MKKEILILGIESSCDETAASVVLNGKTVLSSIVSSQIEIHQQFGGVVPEVASRNHIKNITSVVMQAMSKSGKKLEDMDAIAVTQGAGLVGALLVGINFAKALAYALKKPLYGVSHIHGHISANFLTHKHLEAPFICLMVSGGHTCIFKSVEQNKYELLGTTVDDAAGEAFDKVARVLSLPYPGGPNVDMLSKTGENNIDFFKSKKIDDSPNFSFSGLKTAVINYINSSKMKNEDFKKEDICKSFQSTVANILTKKSIAACLNHNIKKLVVAGGVSANSEIRQTLKSACEKKNIELFLPELKYCGDNAAMIASQAYFDILIGKPTSDLTMTAKPTTKLV